MPPRVVELTKLGIKVKFHKTREEIAVGHPTRSFKFGAITDFPFAPLGSFGDFKGDVPAVTLPLDWTLNADSRLLMPMDWNDNYGSCMAAMADHVDRVLTWMLGKGKESNVDQNKLLAWYLRLSGGDNGLDEGTLVQGWEQNGVGDDPTAKVIDSLDIDINDSALSRYAMSQGFHICFMWSVPDQFMNDFQTGAIFDNPGIPNPRNGHGVPLIDADATGRYRLWTWGTWCWVSQAFVASVQPAAFVVFSTRGFDPATGLDAKGVHITERAKTWQACGGKTIPASVLSQFPPVGPPNPPSHVCPAGQHWDDAMQMCMPDAPPPPAPTGNTLMLASVLQPGTYTIGSDQPVGGLTTEQIAEIMIAEDALASLLSEAGTVRTSLAHADGLKTQLLKYALAPGTPAADTAAIERIYGGSSILHRMAVRSLERRAKRHMLEAAAKNGIVLDMAAIDKLPPGAILPPGWLQAFIAALPQILAFIQSLMKLFGLGAIQFHATAQGIGASIGGHHLSLDDVLELVKLAGQYGPDLTRKGIEFIKQGAFSNVSGGAVVKWLAAALAAVSDGKDLPPVPAPGT